MRRDQRGYSGSVDLVRRRLQELLPPTERQAVSNRAGRRDRPPSSAAALSRSPTALARVLPAPADADAARAVGRRSLRIAPTTARSGNSRRWLSGNGERLRHLGVRAVARVDVDSPRLHDELPGVVVEPEVALIERERHRLRGAGVERDTLEAAQPPHGLRDARHRIVDVELHDVVPPPRAGVLDCDARPETPLRRDARRAEPEVRDLEGRVAQAETELEQRVASQEVAIPRVPPERRAARPSGRLVVVVDRYLADPDRERDGQLAARVDLAEHHVGDSVARLHPREPGLEPRRRVADDVLERQWPTVEEHNRYRLAGGDDRPDQVLLSARQIERGSRLGLASHLAGLADCQHDLVRCTRGRDSIREARVRTTAFWVVTRDDLVVVRELAALRIADGARALVFDPLQDADSVLVAPKAPPRSEHVVLIVRERANDGRVLGGIERQNVALVLEQHHRP